MDIAAWLHSLGMQQYEAAFRDYAIDGAILPELTADDLKDLGVNLVGHRRRLLAAIAGLRGEDRPAPAAPAGQTAPASAAERRQLTVMFCDLVGSTALSWRLDPEDYREVIAAYHRAVTKIVSGLDGFVAKYMATASSSILATRGRTRTMLSGRCGRGWASSTLSVASMSNPSSCKRALGWPPDWWSSAI